MPNDNSRSIFPVTSDSPSADHNPILNTNPQTRPPQHRTNARHPSEATYIPSSAQPHYSSDALVDGLANLKIQQDEVDDIHATEEEHGHQHNAVKLPLDEESIERARSNVRPSCFDYHDILQKFGYTALLDRAFEESTLVKHPFCNDPALADNNIWRTKGTQLLTSCPRAILEGVLDGKLPLKVEQNTDADLVAFYNKNPISGPLTPWAARDETLDGFAPSVYMQAYVNSLGQPPSRDEILRIVTFIRQYISGDPQFHKQNAAIDSQLRGIHDETAISNDIHRYLGAAERLETFCSAVERNLQRDNDATDTLSVVNNPFKYFGFTTHPQLRAQQHNLQLATNRIMGLIVSIGKYAFQDQYGNPRYTMKGYTVCYPADEIECRLGEELFCRFGGGYFYTGRGFNIANAGAASSIDMDELPYKLVKERWEECHRFRSTLPFVLDQMRDEVSVNMPKYKQDMAARQTQKAQREAEQNRRTAQLIEAERRSNEIKNQIADSERDTVPFDMLIRQLDILRQYHEAEEAFLVEGSAERLAKAARHADIRNSLRKYATDQEDIKRANAIPPNY